MIASLIDEVEEEDKSEDKTSSQEQCLFAGLLEGHRIDIDSGNTSCQFIAIATLLPYCRSFDFVNDDFLLVRAISNQTVFIVVS